MKQTETVAVVLLAGVALYVISARRAAAQRAVGQPGPGVAAANGRFFTSPALAGLAQQGASIASGLASKLFSGGTLSPAATQTALDKAGREADAVYGGMQADSDARMAESIAEMQAAGPSTTADGIVANPSGYSDVYDFTKQAWY